MYIYKQYMIYIYIYTLYIYMIQVQHLSTGARLPGGSDDHNHEDPGAHTWLSRQGIGRRGLLDLELHPTLGARGEFDTLSKQTGIQHI